MKKLSIISFSILSVLSIKAQEIHRFFYELNYKPKKDSVKMQTAMMVLDIKKDKSVFKDYQQIVSDSLANETFKKMQKTGTYEDTSQSGKGADFSYSVVKSYPANMEIEYTDDMINGLNPITLGYKENINFKWKIQKDKQKIGEYNAQKATVNFGGRKWEAWFCAELPFSDGPYKFYGLPGLIIKIEDEQKNFSWILKGNKKINESTGNSLMSMFTNGEVKVVDKTKFMEVFKNYKQNPLVAMKGQLTSEMLNMSMPGTNLKIGEFIDKQGKEMQESYKKIDNTIEME